MRHVVLGLAVLMGCADGRDDSDAEEPRLDDVGAQCATADSGPPGGGCRYVTSEGTAVIERIEAAGANIHRCERDPVRVGFRFEPDDPNAAQGARIVVNEGEFIIGDGAAPPRACIAGAGIQVGSRLRVSRKSIVSGACSPTVFDFGEELRAACAAQCFTP